MEPLRTSLNTKKGLDVSIIQSQDVQPLQVRGGQITPRGVVLHCTPDQVGDLHSMGEEHDQQLRYESMMLRINLCFKTGEVVSINSEAQIHSIRRVSQKEFEVEMCFQDMMQDGYRQISRYLVDGQQPQSA